MANTQQTWHHLFQIQHVSFQTTFMYTGSPYCHILSACHDLYTTTMSLRLVALHHPIDHPASDRCLYSCVCGCVCVCAQAKRKKMSAKWKQILKNHISPCELSRHLLFISDSCEHSYVKTVEVVYFSGNVKHSQSKNERKNRQAYRTTVRTLSG